MSWKRIVKWLDVSVLSPPLQPWWNNHQTILEFQIFATRLLGGFLAWTLLATLWNNVATVWNPAQTARMKWDVSSYCPAMFHTKLLCFRQVPTMLQKATIFPRKKKCHSQPKSEGVLSETVKDRYTLRGMFMLSQAGQNSVQTQLSPCLCKAAHRPLHFFPDTSKTSCSFQALARK